MAEAVDYFSNPPPGLDLYESRTASNNAVAVALFILSAVFVALRTITRFRYQQASLQLDDYLMYFGLVLNAGNLACCIAGGYYGLGKHIYILGSDEMRNISLITFAFVFIYAWTVCVIKFSILALYRRIFGMTWLGWFCLFLTTGYLIMNHIVLPLYTRPLSYYWDQWYDGTEGVVLVDEAKFYLGVGIINLFGDICLLAVPIQNVMRLQMNMTQKIAVCFMFLLGSFVCFASLYRIVTIIRLTRTTDISWAKSDVFIWSSVEPSIGIISGCLPTLRPILLHFLEIVFKFTPTTAQATEMSDQRGNRRSIVLNTIETISKMRTRKVRKTGDGDILGSRMSQIDSWDEDAEGGVEGGRGKSKNVVKTADRNKTQRNSNGRTMFHKRSSDSGTWRPDEDEMCLTTTVIQAKEGTNSSGTDIDSLENGDGGRVSQPSGSGLGMAGVHVTKEFAWGEDTRH